MFNKILIFLLCLILSIVPSIKTIGDVYYSFVVYVILISIILFIIMIRMNIKIKLVIISLIMLLYKNNFFLTTNTFISILKEGYINKLENRKDNFVLQKIVYNMYSKNLRLKTDFSKNPNIPSIFVCNYCNDRLENLACILIPKNIVILMRDTLKKISKLHKLVKWAIYIKEKNSYDNTKKEIEEHIKEGRSIFSYVTKTPRLGPIHIENIRTGMFKLAKELNIPVTPIVIDYIDTTFGIINGQNFHITIGDTFYVDDPIKSAYETKKYFKKMMNKFTKLKYIF